MRVVPARSDSPHGRRLTVAFGVIRRLGGNLFALTVPPLMPLLRSRLQAELLTLVLLSPGREWTLTELAGRVGSSVATAQREVTRAEQTGVVSRQLAPG